MVNKVVLLNGPPGSGKDTAAVMADNYLKDKYAKAALIQFRTQRIKFADPLKAAAQALYNLPYSFEFYEGIKGHAWKSSPQPEFLGKSPREILIKLSEEFAKVHGGEDFFGKIAARRINLDKHSNTFIFSDSGFAHEAIPVIAEVGISNVLLVEMSRTGCSFDGDSRSYIGDQLNTQFQGKLKVIKLPNVGDIYLLRTLIHGILQDWLNVETEAA